jgi:hypothetical protein
LELRLRGDVSGESAMKSSRCACSDYEHAQFESTEIEDDRRASFDFRHPISINARLLFHAQ